MADEDSRRRFREALERKNRRDGNNEERKDLMPSVHKRDRGAVPSRKQFRRKTG